MKVCFRSIIVFISLLLVSGVVSSSNNSDNAQAHQKIDALFSVINQRLSYMPSVAAYKWQNNLPIESLERERKVLQSATQQAEKLGLEPQAVEAFFKIQIEIAKDVQRYWFGRWQKGVEKEKIAAYSKDLKTVIRPALIRLGDDITESILVAQHLLNNPRYMELVLSRGEHIISIDGVSEQRKELLVLSLQKVSRISSFEEDTLKRVLDSGILRVGTTGDYLPFSVFDEDHYKYRGIDIELAYLLAKSLGVEVQWVHTSWPRLMEDLALNKFDIAMSGVSIKLFRLRHGLFSSSYHSGGKTPIALCKNKHRYNSLKKIDQKSSRLIVNPGGTNERFLKSNINHAAVVIFDNNKTIFDEIIAGRADVMITDAIEVAVQSERNKALCATMPGKTFDHSDKGFLMPQDLLWKNYVDTWLHHLKRDGLLLKVFDRYTSLAE